MVKLRARCLLLGDAAVGKSCLSHIFYNDGSLFQKNYSLTTGVELVMKCINIPETNDSVWGEPSLLCLVFDLTNEQSFANCTCWMERVQAHCKGLHVPGVLVGNKSDLSARREVQASVAKEWAQSKGLEYHETSAKEMDNCDAPLLSLAQSFYSLYQEQREIMQNLGPG
uniref:Intraflagellar transport 27 n=1 Tax=Poecilia latipinna TaxID=48699 RepID=A0A3B3VVL2_9TELE